MNTSKDYSLLLSYQLISSVKIKTSLNFDKASKLNSYFREERVFVWCQKELELSSWGKDGKKEEEGVNFPRSDYT